MYPELNVALPLDRVDLLFRIIPRILLPMFRTQHIVDADMGRYPQPPGSVYQIIDQSIRTLIA
jgi:hypothetical protein